MFNFALSDDLDEFNNNVWKVAKKWSGKDFCLHFNKENLRLYHEQILEVSKEYYKNNTKYIRLFCDDEFDSIITIGHCIVVQLCLDRDKISIKELYNILPFCIWVTFRKQINETLERLKAKNKCNRVSYI